MYPALTDRLLYYRRYEEALALKTRAELYIMTDDGTQGDEVLARLNPASRGRVKFWRNGLDLDRLHAPTREERAAARASLGLAPDALRDADRIAAGHLEAHRPGRTRAAARPHLGAERGAAGCRRRRGARPLEALARRSASPTRCGSPAPCRSAA